MLRLSVSTLLFASAGKVSFKMFMVYANVMGGKLRFIILLVFNHSMDHACRQSVVQDVDGVCERHGGQAALHHTAILVPARGAVPRGRHCLAVLLDRHHGQTWSSSFCSGLTPCPVVP